MFQIISQTTSQFINKHFSYNSSKPGCLKRPGFLLRTNYSEFPDFNVLQNFNLQASGDEGLASAYLLRSGFIVCTPAAVLVLQLHACDGAGFTFARLRRC
jgi:hypothetical protein